MVGQLPYTLIPQVAASSVMHHVSTAQNTCMIFSTNIAPSSNCLLPPVWQIIVDWVSIVIVTYRDVGPIRE